MAFALKRTKAEIDALPFVEFVGWIQFDRDECIGPERAELMQAIIAQTIAQVQGADVDVYDILASNPWCKWERPMPSDEYILQQIERKTGSYLKQREQHG